MLVIQVVSAVNQNSQLVIRTGFKSKIIMYKLCNEQLSQKTPAILNMQGKPKTHVNRGFKAAMV